MKYSIISKIDHNPPLGKVNNSGCKRATNKLIKGSKE